MSKVIGIDLGIDEFLCCYNGWLASKSFRKCRGETTPSVVAFLENVKGW